MLKHFDFIMDQYTKIHVKIELFMMIRNYKHPSIFWDIMIFILNIMFMIVFIATLSLSFTVPALIIRVIGDWLNF